jgi:phosphate-selective porin
LESAAVGRGHARGVMERGLGWSPELKERGFALYSTDGIFRLHLNGGVQVDYHAHPGGQRGSDPGTIPDTFDLRRLRPILDFRIGRYFRGQIMPDLGFRARSELFNAFIDWDALEYARVRVGQFKPVENVENQQGEFDLVFAERSLVQNFALRRTFGVQLTGRIIQRQLRYDFGVFNGSNGAIGNSSQPELSADSNKLGMGRFMATPFLLRGPRALRKLDVGIGFLYGSCTQSACSQPMLDMGQDRIIFQYNGSVTGNGFHTWVLPQMTWFWGRLGMMSTFVHTWEPKIDRASGNTATLQNQAWMVQGEFALTDDEPAFNRITPKRPFDPRKSGYWGAWTIAARYSEQRVDRQAFALNLTDTTLYAQAAKGFSLALNWYASREIRLQGIWEHTDFRGGTPNFIASPTSEFLIGRVTLIY